MQLTSRHVVASDRAPSRPSRTRRRGLAFALCVLAPAGVAALGVGGTFTTVQDGDWSDPAVWDSGLVPSAADTAIVDHFVEVTAPAAGLVVAVGSSQPGQVEVLPGGDLTAQEIHVGVGPTGILGLVGGDVTTSLLDVGTGTGTLGAVGLLSGSLECDTMVVGSATSNEGALVILGGDGSLTVDSDLVFGASASWSLRPDAVGAAGLQPVVAGNVTFDPAAKLDVLPGDATPLVGDSWVILEFSGTLTGLPDFDAVTEDEYTVDLVQTATTLELVIVDVPPFVDIGGQSAVGTAVGLTAAGDLTPSSPLSVFIVGANPPLALAWLSLDPVPFPALGGTVHAHPFVNQFLVPTPSTPTTINTTWPAGVPVGTTFTLQVIAQDGTVPDGLVLTNALRGTAH